MPPRRRKKKPGVLKTIRKPIAPPTRVEDDLKSYQRAREKERLRRVEKPE
jgi:hypothetical protein